MPMFSNDIRLLLTVFQYVRPGQTAKAGRLSGWEGREQQLRSRNSTGRCTVLQHGSMSKLELRPVGTGNNHRLLFTFSRTGFKSLLGNCAGHVTLVKIGFRSSLMSFVNIDCLCDIRRIVTIWFNVWCYNAALGCCWFFSLCGFPLCLYNASSSTSFMDFFWCCFHSSLPFSFALHSLFILESMKCLDLTVIGTSLGKIFMCYNCLHTQCLTVWHLGHLSLHRLFHRPKLQNNLPMMMF